MPDKLREGLSFFSVQPLRSLCLCGYFQLRLIYHRDTENAEVAQRRLSLATDHDWFGFGFFRFCGCHCWRDAIRQ